MGSEEQSKEPIKDPIDILEGDEYIEKLQRYEAEYKQYLMSKYFTDKTIFGGNIFDVEMNIDGHTTTAARLPPYQSYLDPASFDDQNNKGSNPSIAVQPAANPLKRYKVELLDIKLLHPIKLMDASAVEMFRKKNLPNDVEPLVIEQEKGEEQAAKRQSRKAKTPAKNTKRKLVLSSDFDCDSNDNARELVPLKQNFATPKKPADKTKQPEEAEKPKNKKIKWIKFVTEPLRLAPIKAVPISSLISGVRIEEAEVVATRSRLPMIDPNEKDKGKLIELPSKLSNAQAAIDVAVQKADEIVQERLGLFDKWAHYRTVVLFSVMLEEKILDALAELENNIMKWAETKIIPEALQRREFIGLELRESVLWEFIKQKWANFDPNSPTARDDSAVIQQLEMYAQSTSMMVKVKRQEYELPVDDDEGETVEPAGDSNVFAFKPLDEQIPAGNQFALIVKDQAEVDQSGGQASDQLMVGILIEPDTQAGNLSNHDQPATGDATQPGVPHGQLEVTISSFEEIFGYANDSSATSHGVDTSMPATASFLPPLLL